MLDIMYELPSMSGVRKVVIDDSVITGEGEPLLIYEDEEESRYAGGDAQG